MPARLQAYPLQVEPERTNVFDDIILYASCAPEGSCFSFATGEPVTEERASAIDWRIERAATIVISSPETVETDSIPVREYRFVDLAYDHPADRICTADLLYCYTFVANYDQVRPGLTVAPADTGAPVPAAMERFTGVTMTFDYPKDWFLGRSIRPYFNSDRGDENVTLHNFDPATGPTEGIQPGWIKMDFGSFPLSVAPTPVIDSGYQELAIVNPSGARFLLGRLEEGPWHIWGLAEFGGYFFFVSVLMETDDPALEIVEPILTSWELRVPE